MSVQPARGPRVLLRRVEDDMVGGAAVDGDRRRTARDRGACSARGSRRPATAGAAVSTNVAFA